jgi:hypothetical protein
VDFCFSWANGERSWGKMDEYFFAITAPGLAKTLSDFCKEPSPSRRGGKMLEETFLEYALVRVFAGNLRYKRWSEGLCALTGILH